MSQMLPLSTSPCAAVSSLDTVMSVTSRCALAARTARHQRVVAAMRAALDSGGRFFGQVFVEGFLRGFHVAFGDEDFGEVGAAGEVAVAQAPIVLSPVVVRAGVVDA